MPYLDRNLRLHIKCHIIGSLFNYFGSMPAYELIWQALLRGIKAEVSHASAETAGEITFSWFVHIIFSTKKRPKQLAKDL